MLLKPDPRTRSAAVRVIAEIFAAAGLPDGVLHVLPGGVETGEALVTEPLVRVIAFTGSTRAGRAVGALAAQHLKRVHLELGGNSALLVLDDVDAEAASSVGAWGSFAHQGQVCMAAGRHLVLSGIADAYVAALAARADHLPVGDPTTGQVALGPVIDARQRDKIHAMVTESVDEGARLAAGGTYEGLYYRPDGARRRAADVAGVLGGDLRTGRAGGAHRLGRGRDPAGSRRRRTGCRWGSSPGTSMRGLEIAEQIPSGLVHINDQTINDEATIPFGGVKDSGTGSPPGRSAANLDAFTDTQWVTVRGSLPQYPM